MKYNLGITGIWNLILVLIVSGIFISCERIVEIENPYPEKAVFCNINDSLIGRWQSDSVWVSTMSDSTDTVYLNTRPTFYYDMTVDCKEDTSFMLNYINFSGVVTREAFSVNFGSNDSSIFLFDELDFDRDMVDAIFEIDCQFFSDSTFVGGYKQVLNSHQRSETIFWMRRVN